MNYDYCVQLILPRFYSLSFLSHENSEVCHWCTRCMCYRYLNQHLSKVSFSTSQSLGLQSYRSKLQNTHTCTQHAPAVHAILWLSTADGRKQEQHGHSTETSGSYADANLVKTIKTQVGIQQQEQKHLTTAHNSVTDGGPPDWQSPCCMHLSQGRKPMGSYFSSFP